MSYTHLLRTLTKSRVLKYPIQLWKRCASLSSTNDARIKVGIENFEVGTECEGFKVKSIEEVNDLDLTAVRLSHIKTGADYLHISREDTNNVFCVGFRTIPMDSTGVSHILEHTVLCGSQKYPCRDPFFKMLNRSLSTFMNAMTGADYTIYPFSSQNEKDFENLLSVYMDAVFYPQLKEVDFLQEGWRLEHQKPTDPSTPLELKGVVFNEMKGSFADPSYLLGQHLMNQLLPSHTYSNASGGYPPKIVDLTWQQLKNFHAKHYHPSNSRFFTYGNMPLKNHLQFINGRYLQYFDCISPSEMVPSEKRWTKPRRSQLPCREDPFASEPEKQTTVVVSYLLADINDSYENFVLNILSELLISGPNSPFYTNLLEPNIGIGYAPVSGYDGQTKDTSFSIGLQGISQEDVDRVLQIIESTFVQAMEQGFNADRIEGVLHNIELAVKHQTSNFGLSIAMGITPIWNQGGDPVESCNINDKIARFRQNLQENPNYIQQKIRLYFVDNNHKLITTMAPDKQYETKLQEEEATILADKCHRLSDSDRRNILEKGEQLLELQNHKEDDSFLPTLQLSDINPEGEKITLEHVTLFGTPVQICQQPTNGVTYFRAVINAASLPADLKPFLPLFCLIATRMGAGDWDYRQLDQQAELKTGGLCVNLHLADGLDSTQTCEQGIVLSSHCLDRNLPDMFKLWEIVLNQLRLEDEQRLETLLRNLAADLVNSLTQAGHQYAMSHASSSLTPAQFWRESTGGISFIKRMKDLTEAQQFKTVLDAARQIAKYLCSKNHMRCAMNVSQSAKDTAICELERFLMSIKGSTINSNRMWWSDAAFQSISQQTHHVVPIPIHFTSKAIPAVPFSSPDFAALGVLSGLLTAKYLHPEIREKGGAYGSGAVISPAGVFSFYSYRDPKSLETIQVFDSSIDWAMKGEFSDEHIKEAKLRMFQKIDSPIPPGSKGMRLFLQGITDQQFQGHRQNVIQVTKDDMMRVADQYLRSNTVYGVTVIGPPNESIAKDPLWKIVSS